MTPMKVRPPDYPGGDVVQPHRRRAGRSSRSAAAVAAEGTVRGEVAARDVIFSTVSGIAVDPGHGRIWLADNFRDQLWSVDPRTGAARIEISFEREVPPTERVRFAVPSLGFSLDGEILVVSDPEAGGWLWVFGRAAVGE
jgi:hypothetical protein